MSLDTRTHVHALVDQLAPVLALALAPIDDEPFTDEDRQAVAEADEWLKHNNPIPIEAVLSDFGLTMADWETMSETPLPEENAAEGIVKIKYGGEDDSQ